MNLLCKEFIYEKNTPQCHASTLVQIGDVTVAAWFGGTHEGHDDVRIYSALRQNRVWSKPVCASDSENIPHWNPVLFDNGRELLLFYKVGRTIPYWHTMLVTSSDGGHSWGEPTLLCEEKDGGRGPVKNKPIRLRDGSILAGASIERGAWRAFTDRSTDNGYTWEVGKPRQANTALSKPNSRANPRIHSQDGAKEFDRSCLIPLPSEEVEVIQPTLWEDDEGVHMLLRSKNERVYRSDSPDGIHWGMAYPLELENNNSGLDLVKTPKGLVLCCNPVKIERTPLCLMTSRDGLHFEKALTLEDEPGEYSYPAVIWDEEKIRGTYTWRREKIVYFEAAL